MPRNPANPTTAPYDRAFFLGFAAATVLVPLVWVHNTAFIAYYPKLLLLQVALVYLWAVWMLRQRATGRSGFRRSALNLPILLYLAVAALSIFHAVNRVEAVLWLSHRIALTLLFFALLNGLRSRDILRCLGPIAAAGALVSCIGLVQYAGLGMLWIPSAGMPSATLGYRNFAAMYILLCIPFAALRFLEARNRAGVWAWGMAEAAMLAFLLATRTRAAWVGLLVAGVAGALVVAVLRLRNRTPQKALALSRSHAAAASVALVLVLAFTGLVPPNMRSTGFAHERPDKVEVVQTVASIFDKNGGKGRLDLWKHTLRMIADHSLFGVGIGNWQFIYPVYDRGDIVGKGSLPRRPHNDYLWIASELGIPGLLLFLYIQGWALVRCLGLAANARTPSGFRLPLFLGVALLAIGVHAFFSFPRERVMPTMLVTSILAFIALLDAGGRPERAAPSRLWKAAQTTGLVLLVLGAWGSARALAFQVHYARAIVFSDHQDWNGTTREATQALRYGPIEPQAYLLRGVAALARTDFAAAAQDNLRCLTYDPNLVNALNNLGIAYNGLREYSKALKVLKRLLQIDPKHVEAHTNLGMAYEGLGRLDKAASEYGRSLAKAPNNPIVFYRLGAVYQKQGRLGEAENAYSTVLRLDPAYPPAHFGLGEIYALQGDTTRAVAAYTAFLKTWRGDPRIASTVRKRLDALSAGRTPPGRNR